MKKDSRPSSIQEGKEEEIQSQTQLFPLVEIEKEMNFLEEINQNGLERMKNKQTSIQ